MLVEYLKKYTEQERAKKASLRLQMEGQIGIRNEKLNELEQAQFEIEKKRSALLTKLSSLYR